MCRNWAVWVQPVVRIDLDESTSNVGVKLLIERLQLVVETLHRGLYTCLIIVCHLPRLTHVRKPCKQNIVYSAPATLARGARLVLTRTVF